MGSGVSDWDASSGMGSGDTCGGCEAVEETLGVRELVATRALVVMPLLMNHYSSAALSWAKTIYYKAQKNILKINNEVGMLLPKKELIQVE